MALPPDLVAPTLSYVINWAPSPTVVTTFTDCTNAASWNYTNCYNTPLECDAGAPLDEVCIYGNGGNGWCAEQLKQQNGACSTQFGISPPKPTNVGKVKRSSQLSGHKRRASERASEIAVVGIQVVKRD